MTARFDPPGPCPICGYEVAPGARACPGCGSCHGSGWSDEAAYDGLDLPDEEFDYDAYVAEEFGVGRGRRGKRPAVWVAIVIIVLLLIWLFVR